MRAAACYTHAFSFFVKVADIRPSALPGEVQLLLVGHRRLSIKELVSMGPPLEVEVDHWNTCVRFFRFLLFLFSVLFACVPVFVLFRDVI